MHTFDFSMIFIAATINTELINHKDSLQYISTHLVPADTTLFLSLCCTDSCNYFCFSRPCTMVTCVCYFSRSCTAVTCIWYLYFQALHYGDLCMLFVFFKVMHCDGLCLLFFQVLCRSRLYTAFHSVAFHFLKTFSGPRDNLKNKIGNYFK